MATKTAANGVRVNRVAATEWDFKMPGFVGTAAFPFPVTRLENGWGVAVADVCPNLAAMMLLLNDDSQRHVVGSSVSRFSADMANGDWRLTHQGIAFNRNGNLFDGQNRLRAVVESGATAPLVVFFGAGDKHEMTVLDTGKARTVTDAAIVAGKKVNNRMVATIAQAHHYATTAQRGFQRMSQTQMLALIQKYSAEAVTVGEWFSGSVAPGCDRAPIRAAVLAALVNDYSPSVAERFVAVLTDKVPATEPADSAPRVLRQYITKNSPGMGGGAAIGRDLFLRACAALQYSAEGYDAKMVRPVAKCPYPLES